MNFLVLFVSRICRRFLFDACRLSKILLAQKEIDTRVIKCLLKLPWTLQRKCGMPILQPSCRSMTFWRPRHSSYDNKFSTWIEANCERHKTRSTLSVRTHKKMFAANFSVPGQYVDDHINIPDGFFLVEANITLKAQFLIFFMLDSIALFISLAVMVVQTLMVVIERKAKKQMMVIINKLMWLAYVLFQLRFWRCLLL